MSTEQLVYACRVLNVATAAGPDTARTLRDLYVASDAGTDPQAYLLRPDVVVRLAAEVVAEEVAYRRTVRVGRAALEVLRGAVAAGELTLARPEARWLDRLVGVLCRRAGVARRAVGEAVVVGNTAMHHLFFGLPVAQLAWAPYVPAERGERTVPADDVGLRLARGATVTSPPVVAGFVGADHVAMLLAAGAPDVPADRLVAFCDVGTNTEISLVGRGRHLACSAASGPAFEGAHVEAGMRAAPGAIDAVTWADGRPVVRTVGDAPAVGICGSGLLDAVAVLRAHGVVTEVGALRGDHPLVTPDGVVLAPPTDGSVRPVRLTRRDVGQVQLAKAAIRAGLRLLTEAAGVGEDAIDEIVLAGAFGTYLDPGSARAVGLVPPGPDVRQVGNAAGAGACLLLADPERRAAAARLADEVRYVELTGHPEFADRFTQALRLAPDPRD